MALEIVAWHNQSLAQHQQQVDTWSGKGYRTKSLCVYGDPGSQLYAAVMILRPVVVAERAWFAMSASEFQQTFDDQAKDDFGPYIVSATGPTDNPLIAASFCPVTATPLTRTSLSADELTALNAQAFQNDQVLRWADAFGTPGDVKYIAVWWPNPVEDGTTAQRAWHNDGLADDGPTAQARFDAVTAGRGRAVHIALNPGGGVFEVYDDTEIGPWVSRVGMTSQQYQDEYDQQKKAGLSPVCVAATPSGGDVSFAAIFAGAEDPTPRQFRSSADPTCAPVAAVDEVIETFLKSNDMRGVSLAILSGSRLVYAKGYTWAEPDYPDIVPTTYFRQASVSKTFTALGIMQLIEEGAKCPDGSTFSLDTLLQTVLKLTTPSGGAPTDPRFGQITIRHLLEMTSGVEDIWGQGDDIAAVGGVAHLPASAHDLASYTASLPLKNAPGDTNMSSYNNTGYILLGLVVCALRGGDLIAALQPKLLDQLQITRVRLARSLLADQQPGEAFYHPRVQWSKQCVHNTHIAVGPSLMTPDQPLVPYVYGYPNVENTPGAGGLSAAVTDVARLIATFNVAGDTPILKESTRSTMLQNAAYATAHYGSHGYYGFDAVQLIDQAKGYYSANKGGALFTSDNAYYFWMGGISFVICENGHGSIGDNPLVSGLEAAANAQDWGTTDLFPVYGMPSL
jgi:CubicO group peptidase (beta-lactamase class C family)